VLKIFIGNTLTAERYTLVFKNSSAGKKLT